MGRAQTKRERYTTKAQRDRERLDSVLRVLDGERVAPLFAKLLKDKTPPPPPPTPRLMEPSDLTRWVNNATPAEFAKLMELADLVPGEGRAE